MFAEQRSKISVLRSQMSRTSRRARIRAFLVQVLRDAAEPMLVSELQEQIIPCVVAPNERGQDRARAILASELAKLVHEQVIERLEHGNGRAIPSYRMTPLQKLALI